MFPSSPNPECVKFAKELIVFELTSTQEQELNNSCKFNKGSFCLYEFTKDVSYLEYNEFEEVVGLAKRCQYVRPRCIGVVKKFLNKSEYQSAESMNEISTLCIDTSFKCLDYECSKRDRSQCDQLSEIKTFAPACLR